MSLDIHPCGRFGDWQYYNMDHSILSGKRIADLINDRDTLALSVAAKHNLELVDGPL